MQKEQTHHDLPLRTGVEHAGNVVHDGDVDELLGFSDHVKNGVDVGSSAVRAQWRW